MRCLWISNASASDFSSGCEWAALSSQGQDVERILSFWSDDARVFAPELPPSAGNQKLLWKAPGRWAFRSLGRRRRHASRPMVGMAYLLSTNAVTMPGPEGRPVTSHGPCGHRVAPRAGRRLALRSGTSGMMSLRLAELDPVGVLAAQPAHMHPTSARELSLARAGAALLVVLACSLCPCASARDCTRFGCKAGPIGSRRVSIGAQG